MPRIKSIQMNTEFLIPSIISYQKNVDRIIERELVNEGVIVVEKGDHVSLADIIGECHVSRGFRIFNVPDILRIKPEEVSEYLRKEIGAKVYQGEILAEKKGALNIITRQFTVPCDGILEYLNPQNGQLTIRFLPEKVRLLSGFYGEVIAADKNKKVRIKTEVHVVKSQLGIGMQREGVLKVITGNNKEITALDINADCSQKIIWIKGSITKDLVQKAVALQVKGIIGSGINFRDYKSLTNALNPKEDAGVSLLALNGFGGSEINQEVAEILNIYQNHHVIINPANKELIIPLNLKDWKKKSKKKTSEESIFSLLKVGDRVMIISWPYFGKKGIVKNLHSKKQILDSSIEALVAEVEVENQKIFKIPLANLEKVIN